VEKDKSNGNISNVSAMHIRAMDFEPFSFRINDNAMPELLEGYRPEAKKPGRPEEEYTNKNLKLKTEKYHG